MYSVLRDMDLNPGDVQAFSRLYTAIVGKAVDMQYERSYMRKEGGGVTERSLHDDLSDRLLADPALEGRVQRGTRAAGGFLDIIHEWINTELKVAVSAHLTFLPEGTTRLRRTGAALWSGARSNHRSSVSPGNFHGGLTIAD